MEHFQTTSFIKKLAAGLNEAQNEFFCHFLKFGSYVFLKIEYDDSLRQYLIFYRGKTHEKKVWGSNFGLAENWTKIGPEIRFFATSKSYSLVFL